MEHSGKIYIVQGLFYMSRQTYGIGKKHGIGAAVYTANALFHVLFSGVIAHTPGNIGGPLYGALQDQFGPSSLTEIEFTDNELTFTKQYDKRSDIVQYCFKKKIDQIWIGTWEGSATGSGFAKCLITPVDKDFFDPCPAAEALGISLE